MLCVGSQTPRRDAALEALGCPAGLLAAHRSTRCVTSGRAFQHHSVRSRFLAAERGCKTARPAGTAGRPLGSWERPSRRQGARARAPRTRTPGSVTVRTERTVLRCLSTLQLCLWAFSG